MTISLLGGFNRPANHVRVEPGDPGDLAGFHLPIRIVVSPARGANDNIEVFRRVEVLGQVAFRYVGLRNPVEGLPLDVVAPVSL